MRCRSLFLAPLLLLASSLALADYRIGVSIAKVDDNFMTYIRSGLQDAARRENILILKSVSVIGKLTMSNAIAIRDGRTNGELHAALEDYDKVNRELYDYLLEQNANK